MTAAHWSLIAGLAAGTYAIRLLGFAAGRRIAASPRLRALLADLPGCLVVALVAASMRGAGPLEWAAAAVALLVAVGTRSVPATMLAGFAVVLAGRALGG